MTSFIINRCEDIVETDSEQYSVITVQVSWRLRYIDISHALVITVN